PDAELGWPGTKNGRSHRVWLPSLAIEQGQGALTFPSVTKLKLSATMRAVCAQLGITNKITPHDLRRTHGTFVTRLGFGREAMHRIQNHVEGGIGSVYDRYGYAHHNPRILEPLPPHTVPPAPAS